MKRLSIYCGLFALVVPNAMADVQPNISLDNRPASAKEGTLRFQQKGNRSDNFNGKTLNKAIWENAPKSLNVGAWTFDENNAFVKNGYLNIMATQETHTRTFQDSCWDGVAGGASKATQRELFYKSGAVRTIADSVYGYYEARIKGVDVFPGLSPAFWLYSDGHPFSDKQDKTKQYVDYSEIDIVELQQADWRSPSDIDGISDMDHNLHGRVEENGKIVWKRPKPNPTTQLLHYSAPFDPSKDFHTYAVENRKDKISWYVDGVLVGEKVNTWWHRPMHLIFSMGLRRHLVKFNNACQRADPNPNNVIKEGFPERATMQIDYVKTWEVLPSIWLGKINSQSDRVSSVEHSLNKPLIIEVNYHAGSNQTVIAGKQKGVTVKLVEKNAQGKFVKAIKQVFDSSTTREDKRYGGVVSLSIDLAGVKTSSKLSTGHYYELVPSFSSSTGKDIYSKKSSSKIIITQ